MSIKINIGANFVGSLWTGVMALIFAPLYVHYMGVESYGLVGLFGTLLAMFSLLDMGLSSALNRELARLSALQAAGAKVRDLVRTLEVPYCLMGCLITILVVFAAPWLASSWLKGEQLSPARIQLAIRLMGVALAFQWPIALYTGGLMGLQHQVRLNVLNVMIASLRGIGAVVVLHFVAPTVEVFFVWQAMLSCLHVIAMHVLLWRSLPVADTPARFRLSVLSEIWRFAAGMTGITVLGTILIQADKIILSRMLSLEMFGYYSLASVVAISLNRLVTPVFSAIYPRLTNLVAIRDTAGEADLYHKSAQLLGVFLFPVAAVLAFFSYEILFFWTQNVVVAENAYLLVSVLVVGKALNGVMHVPYALQLAHGWTRLPFLSNLVGVVLIVPAMIVAANIFGAVGVASLWVVLNLGYVIFVVPLTHRKVLRSESRTWYIYDNCLPLLAAVVVAWSGRLLIKPSWGQVALLVSIALTYAVALLCVALVARRLAIYSYAKFLFVRLRFGKGRFGANLV